MASGGTIVGAPLTQGLDDFLLGIWSNDEAQGGPRSQASVNAGAANDLAENNGPITSVAAKNNNGANIVAASSQFLSEVTPSNICQSASQVSFSVWIKPTSIPTLGTVWYESTSSAATGRIFIGLNTNGSLLVGFNDGTAFRSVTTSTSLVAVGSFSHIVGVLNASAKWISVWVNGVKDINETAVTVVGSTTDGSASASGITVGAVTTPASKLNSIADELMIWINAIITDAMEVEINNSNNGRFWAQDTTPPAVPDKVTKLRLQDADSQFITMVSCRVPIDSDFRNMELGRADDATASTPTHILDDDSDGTTSWQTTGGSTDPYRIGSTFDASLLPAEADRFAGWGDPDQTGGDTDRAYFWRSVDDVGNQSAWTKCVDGSTGATASLVPVLAFVSKTATSVTFAVTNTGGKTVELFSFLPGATVGISEGTRVGNGNITASGLTEGVAYRFTAAVQD